MGVCGYGGHGLERCHALGVSQFRGCHGLGSGGFGVLEQWGQLWGRRRPSAPYSVSGGVPGWEQLRGSRCGVHTHMYTYIHVLMFLHVCRSVCTRTLIHTCACVCVCAHLCLSLCPHAHTPVPIHRGAIGFQVCAHVHACLCTRRCLHAGSSVCATLGCVHLSVCAALLVLPAAVCK